ncbi:50S ribosomal protein L30e [Sulfolobus acidocaldarius]|uniref:Large ribosomal subunit protein eL30 n=5 Tax=Sulfolobus acidocaldarius TaxID=2285 RepID=RL30E_SULAC|nr:50S ribosomal protein L30e [Sulfolobus acidocaldarius]P11522.1 RecName: Full=Large ribosomal subunit protein eL30; AltName: Full=50S ribosomal protein L30e [Sulfolobus acidocaldarius DSM 639]pir/S04719/ ribosomal protein L30.eR - Sulfolobus sp. (strain 7) [Sulfolobus sp.]AAY80070.1 50S ribosomal protein L30E [Sulfolobus acidocaldarius DSM 639]AGE70639.1 50S ribosomal protein L30e [Sulfolobus acidocaldarius N8]AGE72912.1 50S ribosomal protein L30e [Sulfolobus acidocaldarius Ron12/I]ALU29010
MSQSFEGELKTLLRSGKVILGTRKTLKLLKTGKVKGVVVSSTLRQDLKDDIMTFSKFSDIPIYLYKGSGYELGTLCGKPFMVSVIGIVDEGESKILEFIKEVKQ